MANTIYSRGEEKTCLFCKKSFWTGNRLNKKYCTDTCSAKFKYLSQHKYKRKTQSEERTCLVCSKNFETGNQPTRRLCSKECQSEWFVTKSPWAGKIPTGTIGAVGELKVAIDLMLSGFDVFRAISPSAPCDIAVLKDKKLTRIEVRTGNGVMFGNLKSYFKKQVKADILAIIDYKNEKIIYYPKRP